MAMQSFERSLPMMLYRTLDAVMPPFRAAFSRFGITEPQWRVLRVLWERERCALLRLAELTLIPAASLVGVVDRLGRLGLAERRRSLDDRRVVHVLLTARGQALEAEVMPLVDECYAALDAALDGRRRRLLDSALDTIILQRPPARSLTQHSNGARYGN